MEPAHMPGPAEMRRRLTVILAADVAGYSRLVAADEEDTLARFRRAAEAFAHLVSNHRGRVFNTAGDAILAEFPSALDATRCAIEMQDRNNAEQDALAPPRQLRFRIGIATGDVVVAEGGDLLGDSVNIAARLESIAEPGGICISEDVRNHVLNKLTHEAVDLGEQKLRNIPRAIRAFKLVRSGREPSRRQAARLSSFARSAPWQWTISALTLVIVIGFAIVARQHWSDRPRFTAQGASQRAFDPMLVPLVTDRIRGALADFGRQPDFKAVAISHIGWGIASGAPDQVTAEREAIDRCKKRDQKGDCRIYAVGANVVWPPLPLPSAADLHVEPLDAPLTLADAAGVRGMPTAAAVEAFLKERDHKALAISESGFSAIANRPDRAEAIRLAVERCSDFARQPCLLISVDGFLTVRIPRGYRNLRPYTLAGDKEMSDGDRRAIEPMYAGGDWRALVRGASARWYAVDAKESETVAVEAALAACRAAERDCTVRAVGNFRAEDSR